MTDQLEDRELQGAEAPRLKPRLLMVGGRPMTTSLVVAEHFEKSHKDVLRAIDNVLKILPATFTERNFALSEYVDKSGRLLPMFRLTQDAFSFVALRFTGAKAVAWQVAYVQAFRAMDQALRRKEFLHIDEAHADMARRWPVWKAHLEGVEAKLADQGKAVAELQSRLDQVNRTMSGPEELGIAMAVTGMNPAAAVVLNLLTRASYERSFTPEFTTWSVRDIANIVHWPKLGQIRSALNQLQRDGLVQMIPGKTKTAARRYRVLEVRVIEAFKRALTAQPKTPESLVMVRDSLSPFAPAVRAEMRTDVPVSDAQAEAITELRDGSEMFKLKLVR